MTMKTISRPTARERLRTVATILLTLLVVGWMLLIPVVSFAENEKALDALRKDMQELKKDVAEIKKLLEGALKKAPPLKTAATVSVKGRPILGQADAPVTIVEFSDYQCPYCKRFATTVFPILKSDYIDTGKVRYVFRDFPLTQIHPQAAKAHEGAHCAGEQDRYWDMHDLLFENQQDLSMPALARYAGQIGLDMDAFDACLASGRHQAAIQQDTQDGAKASVRGTPSFVIGKSGADETVTGRIVRGAQPLATFRQAIETAQTSPPSDEDLWPPQAEE